MSMEISQYKNHYKLSRQTQIDKFRSLGANDETALHGNILKSAIRRSSALTSSRNHEVPTRAGTTITHSLFHPTNMKDMSVLESTIQDYSLKMPPSINNSSL